MNVLERDKKIKEILDGCFLDRDIVERKKAVESFILFEEIKEEDLLKLLECGEILNVVESTNMYGKFLFIDAKIKGFYFEFYGLGEDEGNRIKYINTWKVFENLSPFLLENRKDLKPLSVDELKKLIKERKEDMLRDVWEIK